MVISSVSGATYEILKLIEMKGGSAYIFGTLNVPNLYIFNAVAVIGTNYVSNGTLRVPNTGSIFVIKC